MIDKDVATVASEIRRIDPDGVRTAQVLRKTFDELYDGQRTGRYRWDQLFRTESKGVGALVEINLQREFKFADGAELDIAIADVDVDCKYSQDLFGWMIPPEALSHLCLGLSAVDNANPTFSVGLIRVTADRLGARNCDAKAKLNRTGRESITWLFRDLPMPASVLLQLDRPTVDKILALPSGQKRVNELFRSALGRIVGRGAVATAAQQDDYMKRVRANGGARTLLQSEGIIILGQYQSHVAIARSFGIPIPGAGDSVSIRVSPATGRRVGVVEINGQLWKQAAPNDPIVKAPDLPAI
ncbi:MAG: NaeI family type II restriction endonuclease [Acidobacteriota bacterium]|nr:NaeI family type II restriction endonuclease [Acidobacteriota bacterium]